MIEPCWLDVHDICVIQNKTPSEYEGVLLMEWILMSG
jgi:hypothetical protein